MRLGISITSSYAGRSDRGAVRTVLERARVAGLAELDHLSLGDQHSTGNWGPYVSNVPMIGRIMAEWPADRPVGLLVLVPLWHPVLAAEQNGTLAAMSDAPFIVQTGIGSGDGQFAAMGADMTTRGKVTDRSIRIIGRLLAGDTVTDEAAGVVGASVRPRPDRPVEWWIGSGPSAAAIGRAARLGDAWYSSPGLMSPVLDAAAQAYRDACERHGTSPRIALRRDVLVGDDHATTVRRAREVIDAGYRGMDEQIVAGGVEHVAEQLAAFGSIGVDDIVARIISVDQPTALRSIELLGEVRNRLVELTD